MKRDFDRDSLSLNIDQRRDERDEYISWRLDTHNTRFIAKGLDPVETLDELRDVLEKITKEEEKSPDPLLIESAKIVSDLHNLAEEVTASADAETTGL